MQESGGAGEVNEEQRQRFYNLILEKVSKQFSPKWGYRVIINNSLLVVVNPRL